MHYSVVHSMRFGNVVTIPGHLPVLPESNCGSSPPHRALERLAVGKIKTVFDFVA